ncbi:DUF6134 family protein [Uliginosibacterium sp. H3]|uniref:DUF6134 family protein n=1 Tax=Uliginosibacterium silvisoli TaxID=3114758 RepID=A0ABU6K864_9RHOO|nr:DUF6134 family protein [Uliginosibacterium sp. H3]
MIKLLLTLAALSLLPLSAAAQSSRSWNFRVALNDEPIGTQRFTLTPQGDQRELRSEASFDVKVLFINAYRYRHEATERWQGDCLRSIASRTDDDGKLISVKSQREGDKLQVTATKASETLEGCVMTFAYWNPAILRQTKLLNPQTGEYEKVSFALVGEESIEVRGQATKAKRYRLSGPERPIDLWYGADGDWLALQSTVAGGRRLTYKLE